MEKDDISDDQLKNILISEANLHVIQDWGGKEEKKNGEESKKDRVDAPEAEERPKGESKEKEKEKGKKKGKWKVEG